MSDIPHEQPRAEASDAIETETAVETEPKQSEAVAPAEPEEGAPVASAEAATESADADAAPAAAGGEQEADAETEAEAVTEPAPASDTEAEAAAEPETDGAPAADDGSSMSPAVLELKQRMDDKKLVHGKVIGWNKGGFHIVCEGVTAFCPNSEMELGKVRAPKDYLDQEFDFSVLRIEDGGRRVVLSRGKPLAGERTQKRAEARQKIQPGAEIEGKVASLTNFGAFVDVGGPQGLVHVSEISRRRVEDPSEVLSVGQRVKVKVLKVEQGGKRISLSMKALEPDPWKGVADRFPEGTVAQGTVERTAKFGAFISLEPGLTGLLPASVMNLPRDAQISRMFSPGKQLTVMVMSVDPRRRRISLALEGSQTEGSRSDFESYKKSQKVESDSGFNALAAAFQKIQQS